VNRIQPNNESYNEKEVKPPEVYGIEAYLARRVGPLEEERQLLGSKEETDDTADERGSRKAL